MDDAMFIYRNRSAHRFYDANAQRTCGGADKVIVYVNGILCAMDRSARITIPVSRLKLAWIGLSCFWVAVKGERRAAQAVEAPTAPEPLSDVLAAADEALIELPQQATHRETPEAQWDRLMREMGALAR